MDGGGVAGLEALAPALTETTLERRDRVAVIRFNRPQALNAVTPTTHAELATIFRAVDADPEVRVAILTGTGDRALGRRVSRTRSRSE